MSYVWDYQDYSPDYHDFYQAYQVVDPNFIGFSNKSILINNANRSSIFSGKHQNWIERTISNSKNGQIVTLKNYTDER